MKSIPSTHRICLPRRGGASNLRDYFQAQGYFDVEVEYKDRVIREGATEISYAIERGTRHRFVHLDISGNKYFDEKTIRMSACS